MHDICDESQPFHFILQNTVTQTKQTTLLTYANNGV